MKKLDEYCKLEKHYRICPFCDQNCGTEVTVDLSSKRVVGVRGDKEDPLSKGYICPKAYALKDLHHDPDRLTMPMVRRNGRLEIASWDEALAVAADGIRDVQERHGKDSVAFYFGTGIAHVPALCLYLPVLAQTLASKQVYSASSVDCHPHFLTAASMFGGVGSIPVPDIDHCDYMVLIGANPLQSNGSFDLPPAGSLDLM